jgi:hypothetical protein
MDEIKYNNLTDKDKENCNHTHYLYLLNLVTYNCNNFITDISEYNHSLFEKNDYLLCTNDIAKLLTDDFSPFYYKDITYIPYDRCTGAVIKNSKLKKIPKIIEWPAEYNKKHVFNASLIGIKKDGTYTSYKSNEDSLIICPSISDTKHSISDMSLFLFDLNYNIIKNLESINSTPPWSRDNSRLFLYNKDVYLSSNYIIGNSNNNIISKVSYLNITKSEDVITPLYGGNLHNIARRNLEKNWQFFEHDSKLLSIYSYTPWNIIDCTDSTNVKSIINCSMQMPYDINFHMGTPPIKFNNNYITFCQTKLVNDVYVIIFDRETLKPIQYGELLLRKDFFLIPNFVFISGAVIKNNNTFILSGGINDYATVIFEFSFDEINSILQPIECI